MPYNIAQVGGTVTQPDRRFLGEGPARSAEMTPSFDDELAVPRGCDRLG
jgi:hypothetical protein